MSSVNSLLSHSISSSTSLHRQFKLREVIKIQSCLLSEKSQENVATQLKSKRSSEIAELEGKYLVGTYARAPIAIESGKRCKLYDFDGMEYLDMAAGIAVNSLGHCDEDVVKVLVDQGKTLWHVSNVYYSLPQVFIDGKCSLEANRD